MENVNLKTTADQLAEVRAARARLLDERHRIALAAVPLGEAEQRARDWLAARAWVPDANVCAGLASPAGLSFGANVLPIFNAAAPGDQWGGLVAPALVALLRDRLEGPLLAALQTYYETIDSATCIATEARGPRLAEIDREVHELEVLEEKLILGLEARGLPCARRGDADPSVVMTVHDAA